MENDKKLQAKELYLQTGLNKTQIAEVLGISRRALHYWIRQDNWSRLKQSAEHLPSLMAEKCYYLLHHLTDNYLQDYRAKNLNRDQVETLYKLTLTIKNLKNRTTINESMEMFALFQDRLQKQDPELAKSLMPYVEKYLTNRSSVSAYHVMPDNFTNDAYVEPPQDDIEEERADSADAWVWEMEAQGYIDPDPITGTSKGHRDENGKVSMFSAKNAQKCAKSAQIDSAQSPEDQQVNIIDGRDTKKRAKENVNSDPGPNQ